ncbi:MAG: hypothetical protein WCV68_01780 [Candidatus Paceibacterota bacterium]|jgi:hypothetical protein
MEELKGWFKFENNLKSMRWYHWVLLVVFLAVFGNIMSAVLIDSPAPAQSPSSNQPKTEETASSGSSINFDKVESAVNALKITGLVKKVDSSLNQAYVDGLNWGTLNVEEKKTTAQALAYYVGHEEGTNLYWVDIYDWQSGKKLAKFSDSWGFTTY